MDTKGRALCFIAVALALSACGKKDAPALLTAQDSSQAASRYLAPPQVLAVSGQPGGELSIQGVAKAESLIRGVTPDRKGYGATTGKNGRFVLDLPPTNAPEMIAISEENGRRELQADGWLFVPPDAPDRAVILRAGAPSRPLQAGLVATIDSDSAGGAAIAGVAAPGAAVDVTVDGGTAVRAIADDHGVWGARLGVDKHITAGAHQVRVTSRGLTVDRSFDFTPGATTQIFNAVREPDGWRIAWATPGGGVQTTFLLVGAPRS